MTGFWWCLREKREDSVDGTQGIEWRDVKYLPTALITSNSFQVNSVCDLRISKLYPNIKGRHNTQHQIKQNVIEFSTVTGVRKTIYIRTSFVRLHLAVLGVISKEQEGFYFRYRHCKIAGKEQIPIQQQRNFWKSKERTVSNQASCQ